jgi:threonine dehydrogenase-like Zn-dependent dehydrogenase
VVEASGYPPAVAEGLEMIQKGGKYLILGQTSAQTTPIMPSRINEKGLTIVGSVSAHIVHFYRALQFIKTNRSKYPFSEIISGTYELEDINLALENMASAKEIKPAIDNRGR